MMARSLVPAAAAEDGGFVHAKDQPSRAEGWFEVIVGKSLSSEREGKCVAFVQTDHKNRGGAYSKC